MGRIFTILAEGRCSAGTQHRSAVRTGDEKSQMRGGPSRLAPFRSRLSLDASDPVFAEKSASEARSSLSHSHNSAQAELPFKLQGSQAKTAWALRHNAEQMIEECGLETIVFLTLTVGDDSLEGFQQVWDAAEASRRINALNRRFLPSLFRKFILVTERHKSGAIHFHLLAAMLNGADVREGFYSGEGANDALRSLWAVLRAELPTFGFGRAEAKPIEKTGQAVACYVSKYIEKNLFNRLADDRRKKLVRYSGFEGRQLKPNDFGWCSARATAWRRKAEELAQLAGVRAGQSGRAEVAEAFGPRWAFQLSRVMRVIDDRPLPAFVWSSPFERECARQFVLRVASTRFVLQRQIDNRRSPVAWNPDFEAINEARHQKREPLLL